MSAKRVRILGTPSPTKLNAKDPPPAPKKPRRVASMIPVREKVYRRLEFLESVENPNPNPNLSNSPKHVSHPLLESVVVYDPKDFLVSEEPRQVNELRKCPM